MSVSKPESDISIGGTENVGNAPGVSVDGYIIVIRKIGRRVPLRYCRAGKEKPSKKQEEKSVSR